MSSKFKIIFIFLWCALYGYCQLVSTEHHHNSTTNNQNLTCEEFCAIKRYDDEYEELDWIEKRNFRKPHKMNENYLKESSIIFGLADMAIEDYLNANCYKNMKEIREGILKQDVWAMKVLDSSGAKKPGFVWGDNYWLGSQQGCEAIRTPILLTLSKKYKRNMKSGLVDSLAPFEMHYNVLLVEHNSPWQVEIKCMSERIIHIGLCLPKACTIDEIHNLTQSYLDDGRLEESNIYDLDAKILQVKNFQIDENFFNKLSIKIIFGVVLLTIVLMLCATCLSDSLKVDEPRNLTPVTETMTTDDLNGNKILVVHELNILQKVIKCFDVTENCNYLFSLDDDTSIPIINGLRSISCFWIMIFHVVWFMYFTVENKIFIVSYGERLFFQYVSTAPLLVDIFFTISGFLVIYNFLKNDQKMQRIREENIFENLKSYLNMVFHRYIRLAPLYLVITGLVEILTSYFENSSNFYIHEKNHQTCSKYWWRNVLFIQNLFDYEEMCLVWTWSLACELQFYCVAAFLVFLYAKNPQFAKLLFIIGLIGTIIWSFVSGYQSEYQLSFDVLYNTGTRMYINPFVRIMPYLIGIAAGWYFTQIKGQFELSQTVERCLWNFGITIIVLCIHSTFKRDMSTFSTILLLIIGRLLFSGSVCWMIYGSATGRNCWWSRILESKIFRHINKLSYAIYLLNPFVITIVYSLSKTSTHADPILLCVLTTGFVVIVYMGSVVFSLSFEIPYCKISSLIMKSSSQSKNELKLKKN